MNPATSANLVKPGGRSSSGFGLGLLAGSLDEFAVDEGRSGPERIIEADQRAGPEECASTPRTCEFQTEAETAPAILAMMTSATHAK
jgi:hypothetical protein